MEFGSMGRAEDLARVLPFHLILGKHFQQVLVHRTNNVPGNAKLAHVVHPAVWRSKQAGQQVIMSATTTAAAADAAR